MLVEKYMPACLKRMLRNFWRHLSVGAPDKKVPWLTIAELELGQKEIYGNKHNPRILEYHSVTNLKATTDEVPWCAAFACWCLEEVGIKSPRDAWSRSFLRWGYPLDIPTVGCIVVFERGEGGHVAFYLSESDKYVNVIGGNQSNQVCVAAYPKSKVLGYRWPKV